MSILRIYSKRVTLIVIATTALISIAQIFRADLGFWGYIIGYPSALAILIILGMRQAWKEFPPEAAATEERTVLVPASINQVSLLVPEAVKNCGWKLIQVDEGQRHFKANVGISRKTWGQEMDINLTNQNDKNTNVAVRIVAHHILWDRGQNKKMIAKFFRELGKSLNFS